MAAYNFPNSPSDGDTVTSNGITYTYSSSKTRWDGAAASGSSTTVYATIDDLPLSGASTGDQAYVEGNNRLYIWNGTGWYNIALINTTPSISGANGSYTLATDGTPTTVTITATDPEGLPITYSIASDTSGNIATVSQGTGSNTNVFTITPSTNIANGGTFSLTFRASDGVNIATAVSSFTLQLSIDDSNYTTALITSVGANNATNSSFTDSSTNSHTITISGDVAQNTFSPYRHGGYSTYFDGAGDYIALPNFASNYGNADFTVEAWIYPTAVGSRHNFGDFNSSGQNASSSLVFKFDNDKAKWWVQTSTYNSIVSAASISANAWTHIALVRNGSTITQYINGSSDGTLNVGSANINQSSITYTLGTGGDYRTDFYQGYLSDFRVVKGTAVYTSAFTPPTERLTAITNTGLLTCHLPYIADGSTNSHSITVNGNTKTEPFSPYDYNGYSEGSNGGSIYFDGSSNITVADDASLEPGGSDFCIEFWLYPLATVGNEQALFSKGWSFGNFGSILVYTGSGGSNYVMYGSSSGSAWDLGTNVDTGWAKNDFKWQHLCFSRDGNTFRFFKNGEQTATFTNTNSFMDSSGALAILSGATNGNRHTEAIVSDLRYVVGSAVRTADFTPPTAPLTAITNTSLLLNGTDAAIIDKSQSVKTITLNGNVKSSTTQTKYLTSSMYFDGTGDYLSMEPSDLFNFGSGDFTIETWFYVTTSTSPYNDYHIIGYATNSTNFWAIRIRNAADRGLEFRWYEGSERVAIYQGSDLTSSGWHHVAVTRNGNTWRMFYDGNLVNSVSNSGTISNFTDSLQIGALPTVGAYYLGYISDVRITKGLARYTSNFTPPTAALAG